MKILLLGEYSNVHWTLAEGLRALGHEVCVVSDGDGWKNYQRDISLVRKSTSKWDGIRYYYQLLKLLPRFKGYDVVQIINPCFLELKAERTYDIYNYLREHNKKVFLGAYGMDYYWVHTCTETRTFRYSDFNIGPTIRRTEGNQREILDWIYGEKGKLNRYIATDCDGIMAGLYEYMMCYYPHFKKKTFFVPFPINPSTISPMEPRPEGRPVRFFIGIQRARNEYKGTDIMLRALERVYNKYPTLCEIVKAESVPFNEYQHLMNTSDVLLDQLYSYTPAMNALLAMAKGLVVVGGGEPENYEILRDVELRPIVNVQPNEESVYNELENLVLHPNRLKQLSEESKLYIQRHHDYLKIAKRYLEIWKNTERRRNEYYYPL